MFAVRQRYSGQSGVEQVFVLWAFSLLHASQHALADASGACATTKDERPVNRKSTTTSSARLTDFTYDDRIVLLYIGEGKKQSILPVLRLVREYPANAASRIGHVAFIPWDEVDMEMQDGLA